MGELLNEYTPDYVSPPGETLQETLEALGLTQAELAQRTGRPKKTINEIVRGKAAITPETALQLERVLGVPASFWNARERQYREYLAAKEEDERLSRYSDWLSRFPVRVMAKYGWIRAFRDKVRQIRELLNFFGVASPEQWQEVYATVTAQFRKSAAVASHSEAVAAWLRRGEIVAMTAQCAPFDRDGFEDALSRIRAMTVLDPDEFCSRLEHECAAVGVVVAFVPELPRTGISGATRWLGSAKALIQLSLRYKSDDHLWFTFFHEAGHILKHGKREIFVESDGQEKSDEEREADEFSRNLLIPPEKYAVIANGPFEKETIGAFAKMIGIAPGIVVGRLQHDRVLPYSHCNDLKKRFEWHIPVPSESEDENG